MISENYQVITSSQNNQIKLLEKLNSKKYRQEFGQFVVENLTIISDALGDGYDFESLFVTREFADAHAKDLEYLESKSQAKNFYLLDNKLNKQYSSLDTPSGISAIYSIKRSKLDSSPVIYLNRVSDPGNLGTIMRSALAFNFVNLVLDKNCVDIHNSKVISAARDAIFKLNIIEDREGEWLENNKLPLYVTTPHLGLDLGKFKPAKSFCLVLGSESQGVDEKIIKKAETKLQIKISSKIESLNVATAAAIFFYKLGSE